MEIYVPDAEPVYIYYKLFNEGEPCEIHHPIYANNSYIGRVDATLIPPPHTVSTLVERICNKENKGFGIDWDNEDAFSTVLFKTITSPTPYALEDTISLLGEGRPGSTPQNPLSDTPLDLRELVGYWP